MKKFSLKFILFVIISVFSSLAYADGVFSRYYNTSYDFSVAVPLEKYEQDTNEGSKISELEFIKKSNIIPSKDFLEYGKAEYVSTKEALYVRIVQPYRLYKSTERNYIVLTFPLTNYSLSEIKEYAYLTKEDKVFILSKGGYLYGELSLDKIDKYAYSFISDKL